MEEIKYHLAEDTIDNEDINALIEWLKTNPRLTKGPLTPQFEKKWSDWLGRKYSVFCNSGSSADLLMYYTLLISGVLKNKKIIVPSVGWATTIAPAMQFGFEPIMCEADEETFGLDLNHLEELLQKDNPSTVIMVQVLGVPAKMNELMALKEKYGFILLEDACAAMGSSYKGRKVGTFGDMSAFSLYFGHQISTIEGGIVSTDKVKSIIKEYIDNEDHLKPWSDQKLTDLLSKKKGINISRRTVTKYREILKISSSNLRKRFCV